MVSRSIQIALCVSLVLQFACSSAVDDRESQAVHSPNTAATSTPESPLEDGRHFGYIKSIDTKDRTMEFDLAEFLTGDAASRAAAEDRVTESGEQIDNDYYVRNANDRLRTLSLVQDVEVRIVDWPQCCDLTEGDLATLAAAFRPGGKTERYHGPDSGYWLTVSSGAVSAIEEQFLP